MYYLTCHIPNCPTSIGYASSTAASRCRKRSKYMAQPSRPGWQQNSGCVAPTTAASKDRQRSKYTAPQPTRYLPPSQRPSEQGPYSWDITADSRVRITNSGIHGPVDRHGDGKTERSAAKSPFCTGHNLPTAALNAPQTAVIDRTLQQSADLLFPPLRAPPTEKKLIPATRPPQIKKSPTETHAQRWYPGPALVQTLSGTENAPESAVSPPRVSSQKLSAVFPTHPGARRFQPCVDTTVATAQEETPVPARRIKSLCKPPGTISQAASDRCRVSAWLSEAATGEPSISMIPKDLDFEVLDLKNLADDAGDLCDQDPADSVFDDPDIELLFDLEDKRQNRSFENSDLEADGSDFGDSEFGDSWAEGSECDATLPSDDNPGAEVSLLPTPAIPTPTAAAGLTWYPDTPAPLTPDGKVAWHLLLNPEFVQHLRASPGTPWPGDVHAR